MGQEDNIFKIFPAQPTVFILVFVRLANKNTADPFKFEFQINQE